MIVPRDLLVLAPILLAVGTRNGSFYRARTGSRKSAAYCMSSEAFPLSQAVMATQFDAAGPTTTSDKVTLAPDVTKGEKSFWHNIQMLRVISVYSIVYIHLEYLMRTIGLGTRFIDLLRFGTDLFVTVSGFLALYVLSTSNRPPGRYLLNRWIRIFPLYCIFTILGFFVQNYGMRGHHDAIDHVVLSLLFIPYGPYPVLYPTWTLTIIMEFSVIIAICRMISIRFCASLAAAFIVAIATAGHFLEPSNAAIRLYTNPIIVDFAFGILIFMIISSGIVQRLPRIATLGVGAVLVVICGLLVVLRPYHWPEVPRLFALGLPIAGFLLGVIFLEMSGYAVKSRGLGFIALCSYAIYLCHWFVNIVLEKIVSLNGSSRMLAGALLLAAPFLVTPLAAFVYLRLEVPLTKTLLRRFQAPRRPVELRPEFR